MTEANAKDTWLLIGKATIEKLESVSGGAQLNVASKEAIMPAMLKSAL